MISERSNCRHCGHREHLHYRHANGSAWCRSFACSCRDFPFPVETEPEKVTVEMETPLARTSITVSVKM